MSEIRVTLMVPVLNERLAIESCLECIAEQDLVHSMEVLLVDGGSTDGTLEILQQWENRDPRFRLLDNPRGLVSTGLNRAIENARGAVLVRVDAHTFLAPDYVRTCLSTLEETGAQNVGGPMKPEGSTPLGHSVAVAMGYRFGIGTAPFRFAQERQEVDTVYLGAFPRETFQNLGKFDETLVRNQDYEMNYRIRSAGGRIVVDPQLICRYLTRSDTPALWRQFFSYGYWKAQMLRKYPRSLKPRQLAPPSLVLSLGLTAVVSAWGLTTGHLLLRLAFPLLLSLWIALAGVTTFQAALDHGIRPALRLPWVFATIHLSWGLGFLKGWIRPPRKS